VAPYTHTANYQAEIIATNILIARDSIGSEKQLTADYRAIPRAVYTDPAVASVGMDKATAEKRGVQTITASLDLDELSRANADGNGGRLVLTLSWCWFSWFTCFPLTASPTDGCSET
jgi:dihydrolipoamide dehydrogenase